MYDALSFVIITAIIVFAVTGGFVAFFSYTNGYNAGLKKGLEK